MKKHHFYFFLIIFSFSFSCLAFNKEETQLSKILNLPVKIEFKPQERGPSSFDYKNFGECKKTSTNINIKVNKIWWLDEPHDDRIKILLNLCK